MTVPGNLSSPLLATAAEAAAAAGPIKSLRFNSGDSAYLNRTPSSAGNRKTWTWSAWVKRSSLTAGSPYGTVLFSADTGNAPWTAFQLESSDGTLQITTFAGSSSGLKTNAQFRDPSAWYHLVIAFDTTQSTASDRVKCYVNGVAQTFSNTNYPAQNSDTKVNGTFPQYIGFTNNQHFNGYLADIYMIDGSQLDATSFGAFDDNGVWQAAAYSGTFGTNGFHLLDFANESTVGHDSSGNNNDFTANNITGSLTNYSDDISIDPGNFYLDGKSGRYGFDGNSSTYIDCRLGTGANTTTNIIWEPTGGIASVTKIRVNSQYATHYRINEGTWTSFTSDGSTVQIFSGSAFTLTKLEIRRNNNGGSDFGHRVTFYEINDVEYQEDNPSTLDVLFDVPTNGTQSDTGAGGEVSGNYATLNPAFGTVTGSTNSPENGNLTVDGGSSANFSPTTIPVTSGKWYVEVTVAGSGNSSTVGIWKMPMTYGTNYYQNENYRYYQQDGKIYDESGATSTTYNTYAAGDVIGIALDMDNGKVFFSKNGTFQGSSVPASGTNPAASGLTGTWAIALQAGASTSHTLHLNAGQRSYSYSAPTGFKALCTTNLPTPTIADGSDYFDIKTYTGNGGNQTISGYDFGPDFVWLKNRAGGVSSTIWHVLADTVRGNNAIFANTNYQELSGYLNGFTTDGFGVQVSPNDTANRNGDSYVAWAWEGGSSTVTNTDGNISAQVRANQSAGFSIVTYTGNGSTSGTVGHGLNASPGLVFVKARNAALDIKVNHSSLSTQYMVSLNENYQDGIASWNGVTNSVFKPARSGDTYLNGNGTNYLAYCFAPIEGFSKFSSFTGNGAVDGPFVYTGFRPALIIYKNITDTENWLMIDSTRDPYNPVNTHLHPNLPNGDSDATPPWADFLSNGFKLRNLYNETNGSGDTILYMAWAENPFQVNGGLAR